MSHKAGLIAVGVAFLLVTGLNLNGLPFIRQGARFSDSVLAHWPNALFLNESVWLRHEFPIWRETTMAGQPFAANPLNKTAYPFQWLAVLFPPTIHLNIMVMFHLLVAGIGMWYWARTFGLRQESLVLVTISYVFAPRMMGHLAAGHLDITYAMAWWPWLMWSVRQLFVQPSVSWRSGLQLGMIAALLLSSDLRVSLFAFLTASVYGISFLKLHTLKPTILNVILGIAFCLPLVAVLLVPLGLWQPFMSRSEMTLSDAGSLSLEPGQLLGLILPANFTSVETLTYIGIPVSVLAIIGVLSRPRAQRLVSVIIVLAIILYGLGTNSFFWSTLTTIFPVLLWFRVPSRIWLILTLFAPIMAGYGLQWLLTRAGKSFQGLKYAPISQLRLVTVSWSMVLLLMGVFALLALPQPVTGLVVILTGVSVGILILVGFSQRLSVRWLAILLIAVTGIDLFATGHQWLEWRSETRWLQPGKTLAEWLVQAGAERIYSPTYSLEQQVAEAYGLQMFGGVDPFQLSGIVRAVAQGSGVPVTKYEVVLPPLTGIESDADIDEANQAAKIDTSVLAEWRVSHVVAGYSIDNPRLKFLDLVNGVYIYSNLDYQIRQADRMVPNWPTGWPGLPDNNTVKQFNQITILAAIVSGLAWILCTTLFIYLVRFQSNA